MTVRHTRRSTDENIMEVSKDGSAPAAILRYVYPGVTPKNGRIVTVAGDGGSAPLEMRGAEIASALREDGVDTSRWRLRYYHKAHEGWKLLDLETTVAFTPPDQTRLEIALEPADPHPSAAAGATRVDTRDGFFGIGIVGGKNETNQGTLWRSAWQLGAAFTFTVGARFEKTSADTTKTWTSLPAYAYEDWATFAESQPHAAAWVAVEMGGTPWRNSSTLTGRCTSSEAKITAYPPPCSERARITCRYQRERRDAPRVTTSPSPGVWCSSTGWRSAGGRGVRLEGLGR